MTRATVLKQMNDDELAHHLAESREEVFQLRFQLAMGKQDNSSRLGHVRREVARALTIQREREVAAARPTPATQAKTRKGAR